MDKPKTIVAFPGREAFGKERKDDFYRSFPEVRRVFELAGDLFHQDFVSLCYRSDTLEERWLPLVLAVHSYAISRVVCWLVEEPAGFIGYSQGEFLACAAAGAVDFADVLKTMEALEELLREPVEKRQDMYRIVEMSREELQDSCRRASFDSYTGISAYISRDQHVISGEQPSLQRAVRSVRKRGARWVLPLNTRRGFHSCLCDEVQRRAAPYFKKAAVRNTVVPVYSCLDGGKSRDGQQIWSKLSRQISHPLRWETLVNALNLDGATRLIEIGPGCTVSANTRIGGARFTCTWIHQEKDLEGI